MKTNKKTEITEDKPIEKFSMDAYLDVKGLSEYMNVSQSLIYSWTSSNAIPYYRFGKKLLFKKEEIEEFIQERITRIKSSDEIREEARSKVKKMEA